MALAQKLGAVAVLMANNGSTGFFRMTQTGYSGTISIPSVSMPQNTARYLINALAAGSSIVIGFSPYVLPAGETAKVKSEANSSAGLQSQSSSAACSLQPAACTGSHHASSPC